MREARIPHNVPILQDLTAASLGAFLLPSELNGRPLLPSRHPGCPRLEWPLPCYRWSTELSLPLGCEFLEGVDGILIFTSSYSECGHFTSAASERWVAIGWMDEQMERIGGWVDRRQVRGGTSWQSRG